MRWRWFRRLLLALLLLVAVPVAALLAVLGSESGTRWLLEEALSASGDEWTLGSVRGDLLSTLELTDLHWSAGATSLGLREARLAWRPIALFERLLHIEQLRVVGLEVVTPPAAEAEPPSDAGTPSIPALPLAIRIDAVHIEDVLTRSGADEFRLASAALATRIDGTRVRIETLAAQAPGWQVSVEGEVEAVAPFPFRIRLDWQASVPGTGEFVGRGGFDGNLHQVAFSQRLTAPFGATLEGTVDIDGVNSKGTLKAAWDALRVPVGDGEWRSRAGSLDFQGSAADFSLGLAADVDGPGVSLQTASMSVTGSVQTQAPHALNLAFAWDTAVGTEPAAVAGARLTGGGSVGGDLDRLRVDHALSAPFRLTTGAVIGLAEQPPGIAVEGSWQQLRWPLAGVVAYLSESGEYRVEGNLDHLRFELGAGMAAVPGGLRDARVDIRGESDLAEPFAFDAHLGWQVTVPDLGPLTGAGDLAGNIDAIDVDHALTTPFVLTTRGRVQPGNPDSLLDLKGDWQTVQWPLEGAAQVSSSGGSYSLAGGLQTLIVHLAANLAADGVPLSEAGIEADATLALGDGFGFDARFDWHGTLPDEIAASAEGSARGDLSAIEFRHALLAPFPFEIDGRANLGGATPRLEASGTWSALRWPLAGEAEYRSPRGRLGFSGTPEDYRVSLEATVEGAQVPPAEARLTATGSSSGAHVEALGIDTLGGNLTASGRFDWAPGIDFDLDLAARDIDPGRQWPEWPGKLALRVNARGGLAEGHPDIEISSLDLKGMLRGYPVSASGSARLDGSRVRIPALALASGSNRLRLSGEVAESLAVDFKLDAPDLAGLWPGLEGKADASGSLAGPATAPQVILEAHGEQLRLEGQSVARLDASARVDAGGGSDSRVEVRLGQAVLGGEAVASLVLEADGGPARHQASVTVDAAHADMKLALQGGWDGTRWSGQLSTLDIEPAGLEPWTLATPVALRLAATSQKLDELCLAQGAARLCAALSHQTDDKLQGKLRIVALPLAIAGPWLPPELGLEGSIEASGDIAGTLAAPRAGLTLTPPPGALTWKGGNSAPLRIAWRDFRVEARYADDRLDADAGVELPEFGKLSAQIGLGTPGAAGDRALSGRVQANVDDLAMAAAFVPQIANPSGRIAVDLELGGTLAQPGLNGSASLTGGALQLPDVGLQVTDIEFSARNQGEHALAFDGGARSGEGTLSVKGQVELDAARGFPLVVDISGEQFEVSRLPIAHVFASPDLQVRRDAELTRVTGSVTIPRADFRLRELPVSAVPVSDDEVLVQAESAESKPAAAAVATDLTLLLGDQVRFSGFGLDARINGRLRISSKPAQPLLGEGAIALEEAYYKAYGQDLAVERGRLLFAGPLDNPGLDVRATRRSGEVVAVLELTGTASRPSARVFSEPPLPDAEAFAYLLTGKPLSGASSSDGAMLSGAALALGLDNADGVTRKIGRQLGLDEVGLTGGGSNAGLVLGKYLTPDIYLSYVLNLFGGEGAVQVEYKLTDSISVQGRTSAESQEVDLIYRYERD